MVGNGIKQSKRSVIHSIEVVLTVMGITSTKLATSSAVINRANDCWLDLDSSRALRFA
tara:strand:+ start:648 stop:821 length:174 start_codon:yes stop_codon:yes gene_type:complete